MANIEIPPFLRKEGDALLYNGEGELVFYIPEDHFGANSKIAVVIGSYVSMLGICNYAILDKNGKIKGDVRAFKFPTIMLCKPDRIESVKNLQITKTSDPANYKVLHFKDGDEVVTSLKVPVIIDNVEIFFSMMLITGKIPTTIPYNKIHEYFKKNANLNGFDYGMNMQLFGMVISELCRNPNDLSQPFRLSGITDMNGYKPISIKSVPNYISPYVSITSENFDESLMAAVTTKEDKYSPLERVLTI